MVGPFFFFQRFRRSDVRVSECARERRMREGKKRGRGREERSSRGCRFGARSRCAAKSQNAKSISIRAFSTSFRASAWLFTLTRHSRTASRSLKKQTRRVEGEEARRRGRNHSKESAVRWWERRALILGFFALVAVLVQVPFLSHPSPAAARKHQYNHAEHGYREERREKVAIPEEKRCVFLNSRERASNLVDRWLPVVAIKGEALRGQSIPGKLLFSSSAE